MDIIPSEVGSVVNDVTCGLISSDIIHAMPPWVCSPLECCAGVLRNWANGPSV